MLFTGAEVAFAQMSKKDMMKEGGMSKDILVTLPVVQLGRDAQAKIEFNLRGKGSLAIEGSMLIPGEEYSDQELAESPGHSLQTEGYGGQVMISRFTQPMVMGGFFWGFGVGYRQLKAHWKKAPHEEQSNLLALADEDGLLDHDLTVSGNTFEGRLGYRYVGMQYGFVIGGFVAIRHFENKIKSNASDDNADVPELHEQDEKELKHRLMSQFYPSLEIGWAF